MMTLCPSVGAQPPAKEEAPLVPGWNKTKITVCTSSYTPLVYCQPDMEQDKYTGVSWIHCACLRCSLVLSRCC